MTEKTEKLFLCVFAVIGKKWWRAVAGCMALLLFFPVDGIAQDMAVKTNAIGWATVSPNLAFEYRSPANGRSTFLSVTIPSLSATTRSGGMLPCNPRRVTGCALLSVAISWVHTCCICTTTPGTCTCHSACGSSCATIVFRVTSTAGGLSTVTITSSTGGGASRGLSASVSPIPARSITVVAIADVIREYRRKIFSCLPSSRFRWSM